MKPVIVVATCTAFLTMISVNAVIQIDRQTPQRILTGLRPHYSEDDPHWSCLIDGNRICGPVDLRTILAIQDDHERCMALMSVGVLAVDLCEPLLTDWGTK